MQSKRAHLSGANNKNDKGLSKGPPQNSITQILRELTASRFAQPVVRLKIVDHFQLLVNVLSTRFNLEGKNHA